MNNLSSIHLERRTPLSYNPGRALLVDGVLFFGGVALTVGIPEGICSVVGGSRAAVAFIASLVIGTGWGLVRYYYQPFTILSCLSKEPVIKAPPSVAVALKRAA